MTKDQQIEELLNIIMDELEINKIKASKNYTRLDGLRIKLKNAGIDMITWYDGSILLRTNPPYSGTEIKLHNE
jgi:hypothetical protein